MARTKFLTDVEVAQRKQAKENKAKHEGKDWAILNTADKFEIIGDALKDLGYL